MVFDFESFTNFLHSWQELSGALLGGLFSLMVALLVSSQARRAEERSSALLLIAELVRIESMVSKGRAVADQETQRNQGIMPQLNIPYYSNLRMVELFCFHRVRLSPLFESAMYRVIASNNGASITLTTVCALMREVEPVFERVEEAVRNSDANTSARVSQEPKRSDVQLIANSYDKAAKYSHFAILFLQEEVLSSVSFWPKIRRWFLAPKAWENDFEKLLEKEAREARYS